MPAPFRQNAILCGSQAIYARRAAPNKAQSIGYLAAPALSTRTNSRRVCCNLATANYRRTHAYPHNDEQSAADCARMATELRRGYCHSHLTVTKRNKQLHAVAIANASVQYVAWCRLMIRPCKKTLPR